MDELKHESREEEGPRRPWEKPCIEWEDPLEVRIGFQLACVKSPGDPFCPVGQIAS